jgi:DNA polymerase III epsilon subunit-like protein
MNPNLYLFFDTETTGLPRDWKAPITNTANWPRLVQLAWMLCDEAGTELAKQCRIVKPDGFTIPDKAASVHGISTDRALAEGVELKQAMDEFMAASDLATKFVAHNIAFDEKIVGAECVRLNLPVPFVGKPMLCTMKESTQYCKIPGPYGVKWPTLTELHVKLFGKAFDGAHDAMSDVGACKSAYYELKTRKVMS